jgi:excisionase family DNA binding protein
MQQYYTLEEAARVLQKTPDELKEMAKKNELRAFQDRGTWRFRAQEINERARALGLGSDPELQPGEPVKADAHKAEEVPLGEEKASPDRGPRTPRQPSNPPSSGAKTSPPRSPRPAGDSDVRLVMDAGALDFNIDLESEVKPPPSSGPKSPTRKSRVAPPEGGDSGVRIVPLDKPSDSDVKIVPTPRPEDVLPGAKPKSPSDSDIRLEDVGAPRKAIPDRGSDDMLVTEEIDLDAEAQKAAEAAKKAKKPKTRARPRADADSSGDLSPLQPKKDSDSSDEQRALRAKKDSDSSDEQRPLRTKKDSDSSDEQRPLRTKKKDSDSSSSEELKPGGGSSPFELTDDELVLESPVEKTGKPSSSDFELIPLEGGKSASKDLGSGDVPLLSKDEAVDLGAEPPPGKAKSGINLGEPADSGISLEQGGSDEIEFELSLDAASSTPKPAPAPPAAAGVDSSSEFELSLDEGSSQTEGSDSEFELSLDAASESDSDLEKASEGSDSEFELTLDAEGDLAPASDGEGKDIFEETNFDVPALDESGSEAVALEEGSSDTDLESSEVEVEVESKESSGSAVVPLEDEEADPGAATVARPRPSLKGKKPPAGLEEVSGELDMDLDKAVPEEEEVEEEEVVAARPTAQAEWGPLPAILLFPAVLVLFLAGVMGFELVQGMWGYNKTAKPSTPLIDKFARTFIDDKLPQD